MQGGWALPMAYNYLDFFIKGSEKAHKAVNGNPTKLTSLN